MGQIAYENSVYERLRGKRHLQPIFSGGNYDMNRRLREYDPDLFMVWNNKKHKYEIHSLNHIGNTYACEVPNNRLDARIEQVIRAGDLRVRGKEIFREVDDWNERIERIAEKNRRDELKNVAGDLKRSFAKLAWNGV